MPPVARDSPISIAFSIAFTILGMLIARSSGYSPGRAFIFGGGLLPRIPVNARRHKSLTQQLRSQPQRCSAALRGPTNHSTNSAPEPRLGADSVAIGGVGAAQSI